MVIFTVCKAHHYSIVLLPSLLKIIPQPPPFFGNKSRFQIYVFANFRNSRTTSSQPPPPDQGAKNFLRSL